MNTATDIDQYIAGFSPEIKELLHNIRACICKAAPEATEKISYGMPTFVHNGLLVHFAVNKNHIGFYPAPSGIEAFKDKLTDWKFSKGKLVFKCFQTNHCGISVFHFFKLFLISGAKVPQ